MNGNNEFLKNIKEQIANIEKRNYTTPEQRAQAFEWIIIQMQEYKETAIFTEKELSEFEKIFNWLNSEYKKLNTETKQKVQELDNQVTSRNSQINDENISIKNLNTKKTDWAINVVDIKLREILNKKDNLKFGLDMISAIANQRIEKEFFPELTKEQFEDFKKSLPAIRWIAGAILLENLHKKWYDISFDKNNKIILKSEWIDDNNVNEIINASIKRDPNLGNIIKEGLLFMDGNILKYGKAHTDSKGKNLDMSAMTNEKYLDFLKWEKEKTWATKIILANPQILDWMNLAKMAESSQYFTPVVVAMNEWLQKQIYTNLQNAEKNNWTSVSSDKKFDWSDYSKWWKETKNWINPQDPLSSLGHLAGSSIGLLGVAADDLADSFRDKPQAVGGVMLLSFLSFIFLGFKDTIKLMAGLTIGWLAYKNFVKDSKNETSETVEISQNQKDSQNERLYNFNKTKSQEQVKEIVEMVSIFYPEKLSELNAYFSWKWDGVSKDLKAKLDILNTEQIAELKKAVNEGNNGVKKLEEKMKWANPKAIKSITEKISLREAMNLVTITDEQARDLTIKTLEEIKKNLTPWTQEYKIIDSQLKKLQNWEEMDWWDWVILGLKITGGIIAVGAVAYAYIKYKAVKTGIDFTAKALNKTVWVAGKTVWWTYDHTIWKTKVGEKVGKTVRDAAKFALNNPVSDFVIDTAKKLDATIHFKDWSPEELKKYWELEQKIEEIEKKLEDKKKTPKKWKTTAEIGILNNEIKQLEEEKRRAIQDRVDYENSVKERIKETKVPKTQENKTNFEEKYKSLKTSKVEYKLVDWTTFEFERGKFYDIKKFLDWISQFDGKKIDIIWLEKMVEHAKKLPGAEQKIEVKDFELKEGKFNFKAFVEKLFAHTLKK